MQHPLISKIGFVALVSDIAGKVGPGDGISASDEIRVSDGPEGFANVGGVGDVAVCAEEYGAEAGGVGSIANVGVGGLIRAVIGRDWQLRRFRGERQSTYVPSYNRS